MYKKYELIDLETGEMIVGTIPQLRNKLRLDEIGVARLQWCANQNLTFSIIGGTFIVQPRKEK